MENKSQELTFMDLLEIIFKHKVLLTVITLIVTIVGTLFLGVIYTNNSLKYTTSFSLDYPGSATLTLPDGSTLKYTEFISEESLLHVKNSNPNYKDIDVESIALYNDISIKQEIVPNSANLNDTIYTITISAKYFPAKDIAKSFIQDLAMLPIVEIKEMVANATYDSYLTAFDNSTSFDNKLTLLNSQKNYILSSYSSTTSMVGNISVNGKSLNTYKQQIENYFLLNSLDLLIGEFDREGYAPKNDVLAVNYQTEIDTLKKKHEINEAVIAEIRAEIGKTEYANKEVDFTKIATLVEENVRITKKIEVLNLKLQYAKGDLANTDKYLAFEAKVNEFYTQLKTFTNEYIDNNNNIYNQLSSVSFENSSIVKEQGGMSILVAGVASFIVGFVVASCAILIINVIKKRKETNN